MKKQIKTAVDNIINDTIDVPHLPPEYQEGIKQMKRQIVDYILSIRPMVPRYVVTEGDIKKINQMVELLKK